MHEALGLITSAIYTKWAASALGRIETGGLEAKKLPLAMWKATRDCMRLYLKGGGGIVVKSAHGSHPGPGSGSQHGHGDPQPHLSLHSLLHTNTTKSLILKNILKMLLKLIFRPKTEILEN